MRPRPRSAVTASGAASSPIKATPSRRVPVSKGRGAASNWGSSGRLAGEVTAGSRPGLPLPWMGALRPGGRGDGCPRRRAAMMAALRAAMADCRAASDGSNGALGDWKRALVQGPRSHWSSWGWLSRLRASVRSQGIKSRSQRLPVMSEICSTPTTRCPPFCSQARRAWTCGSFKSSALAELRYNRSMLSMGSGLSGKLSVWSRAAP